MSEEPTLIIQMQRMGDLILSFPLCSRLLLLEPERPVWLVGEPAFFSGLKPLAPHVVFFAPDRAAALRRVRYRRVINLSHRDEALDLAGSLHAAERIGAFRANGNRYIAGDWRLYRHALVGNNRHNRFHWADLEALGVIPPAVLAATRWPPARPGPGEGRIGLFVGASEAAKRPDPAFWGRLAALLLRRGLRPVLLGGPAEREAAAEATRLGDLPPAANCSGRFSLAELAAVMRSLDLLITPDTGPMHLAAWVGTPTLNLSMGPVNALETAPAPPGHTVLRPTDSCSGCWRCFRGETACCRRRFRPETVAGLAARLTRDLAASAGGPPHDQPPSPCRAFRRPSGLRLDRTARDERGLFTLTPLSTPDFPDAPNSAAGPSAAARAGQREKLALFWQEWFLSALGGAPHRLDKALADLVGTSPRLVALLQRNAGRLTAGFAAGLRRADLPDDFWRTLPPLIRPLSSYLQALLENGDYSPAAWTRALNLAEDFAGIVRQG